MGVGLLRAIVPSGVQQCVTREKSKAAINTFNEQISLMVWVGKDLKHHLVSTFCHGKGNFYETRLLKVSPSLALSPSGVGASTPGACPASVVSVISVWFLLWYAGNKQRNGNSAQFTSLMVTVIILQHDMLHFTCPYSTGMIYHLIYTSTFYISIC